MTCIDINCNWISFIEISVATREFEWVMCCLKLNISNCIQLVFKVFLRVNLSETYKSNYINITFVYKQLPQNFECPFESSRPTSDKKVFAVFWRGDLLLYIEALLPHVASQQEDVQMTAGYLQSAVYVLVYIYMLMCVYIFLN